MTPRRVGVVTVARSDYGILRPVLAAMDKDPRLEPHLIVAGMHLSLMHGRTIHQVEADKRPVAARVPMTLASDDPDGIARSIGLGVLGFADAFARLDLDLLLVLGDRYEMLAAAVAAQPFNLPITHLHGGEITLGAMDDSFRHAITKLSHYHGAATATYAKRLVQMGEEPWRVTVTGAPGLDAVRAHVPLDDGALEARFGVRLPPRFLLATFHPVTRHHEDTARQVQEWLAGLGAVGLPVVFTAPNADTSNATVRALIEQFVADHPPSVLVGDFGTAGYFTLMQRAAAMVGNSSSGIIEAASFGLPVVNVGDRQEGRLRPPNVLDAPCTAAGVEQALRRALDPAFRTAIEGAANPYGDGQAAGRVCELLATVPLGPKAILKPFHDDDAATASATIREAAR